jgi:hypothetical protein
VALKDALEGTSTEVEASNDVINRRWLSIKAAMAEEELEAIRERAKMGARGRALKGKLKGKIKFGYRMEDDGKPVIDEHEAEVVRRVFKLYLEGLAINRIATLLNEERMHTPTGEGRWWSKTVWYILGRYCLHRPGSLGPGSRLQERQWQRQGRALPAAATGGGLDNNPLPTNC